MFTFNRNEQVVLLLLCGALLVGAVVSYFDLLNPDAVPEFEVRKNAVPVPPALEEAARSKQPVDLNRATESELQQLPGIGPAIARRIVDYREANGPFRTIEGLTAVRGVGPKMLERIRSRLAPIAP